MPWESRIALTDRGQSGLTFQSSHEVCMPARRMEGLLVLRTRLRACWRQFTDMVSMVGGMSGSSSHVANAVLDYVRFIIQACFMRATEHAYEYVGSLYALCVVVTLLVTCA